jgi:hypothetical protein
MLVELKRAVRYRAWVSGHPAFLLSQSFDHERNVRRGLTDEDHLRAAAQWLAAAQDSQSDGGVAGRYQLGRGWTSSYPETTGYIVPTFLALSRALPKLPATRRTGSAIPVVRAIAGRRFSGARNRRQPGNPVGLQHRSDFAWTDGMASRDG